MEIELPKKNVPPGKLKIAAALRVLLAEKEFGAITTAEIARTAGVTEALIYKYYRDKRDLLHQVLGKYLEHLIYKAETDVKGIKGALNKLRKIIWSHVTMYANDRVFARILLLEVRNYPDYFKSDAYKAVRRYSNIILSIIEEGVRNGEIRQDVPPELIRQVLLGAVEHACLPAVIFNGEIIPDDLTDGLCELIFSGLSPRKPIVN
ncbi:MAG TPA: TetR/AcrR family transcriptional regulator [Desulfomonilaceae bacterium]|nr:TetR/AcrR family transcriptional regulator [Desulfomonilaceae bacterium]